MLQSFHPYGAQWLFFHYNISTNRTPLRGSMVFIYCFIRRTGRAFNIRRTGCASLQRYELYKHLTL